MNTTADAGQARGSGCGSSRRGPRSGLPSTTLGDPEDRQHPTEVVDGLVALVDVGGDQPPQASPTARTATGRVSRNTDPHQYDANRTPAGQRTEGR